VCGYKNLITEVKNQFDNATISQYNNGDSEIYNYEITYLVLNTFKRIKENGTVIVQGEEIVVTWSSSKFRKIINVKIDKRPFLNSRKDPKKKGSKRKWS